MKSPSKPARGRSHVAQTIAVANPMSHIAAIIGPGCATQVAPADRSEASDARAQPRTAAAITERKNEKTPRVIAFAPVSRSRARFAAPAMRTTNAAAAIHFVHACGHHSYLNDKTSKKTASAFVDCRKSVFASVRVMQRM